jgi:peptide/nickel transport system substrate-binding protein
VTQFDGTGIVRLTANDDYWGGTPPAAQIEFRAVPEYAARIAGMVAGDFQLMAGVPTDEVETVQGYEGLEYVARPIDNYIMLAYNLGHRPRGAGASAVGRRYVRSGAVQLPRLAGLLRSLD